MEIRKAFLEDLDQLAIIFNSYRIFCSQASDVSAGREFLAERMKQNQSVIFIAISGQEIVGFTQLYPIFSSVKLKNAWLLNDLYVHEKMRKQGIAAALLEQAKAFCKDTNAGWLLLQTADNNHPAQNLYKKNGWEKVSDFFYMFEAKR